MAKYISLSNVTFFFTLILLSLQSCQFDESEVKFERFEFLDEYTGKDFYKDERFKHLNNKLHYQAYLVHGYKKKYDQEINQIIDQYLCDSILPNLQFERSLYIQFFKASRNTNRENFKVRPKHKMIHARSHDLLLHFNLFHPNDSTLWITKQKIAGTGRPNPPGEKFYCK